MQHEPAHGDSRGTGDDTSQHAEGLALTCLVDEAIDNRVGVFSAPPWSSAIQLGRAVFTEAPFTWRESPRGQQSVQVRSHAGAIDGVK